MHVCVKRVERSLNSFNCYSCYSGQKIRKWCLWLLCNTAYRVLLLNLLLMSKGLKVSNTLYAVASCPSKGYIARFCKIPYVKGVKRNKNSHDTVDLRHLSLMSKESKVHSIYNVDSNSKYSNYCRNGIKTCNNLN